MGLGVGKGFLARECFRPYDMTRGCGMGTQGYERSVWSRVFGPWGTPQGTKKNT